MTHHITDEQVVAAASLHLGECVVESCGLGDIKDFARAVLALAAPAPAVPSDDPLQVAAALRRIAKERESEFNDTFYLGYVAKQLEHCPVCNGDGLTDEFTKCQACNGTGDRAALTAAPAPPAQSEPVQLGELAKRNIYDAIRGAYDLGYNDARNARAVPGDSAPGYEGRSVEADHGGALLNSLNQRLRNAPAQPAVPESADSDEEAQPDDDGDVTGQPGPLPEHGWDGGPAAPTDQMEISIRICVPPDFARRGDMQSIIEREIKADRWCWHDLPAVPEDVARIKAALYIAMDALDEIALAGMSGTGQESEEAMRDWHARRAWEFIGIAARARDAARAAEKGGA